MMFKSFKSSWNVLAANRGSLSDIIRSGRPNRLYKLFLRSSAVPSQVNVLEQGHKITPFKRPRSTTTRIELNSLSVIRSMGHSAKGYVVLAPPMAINAGCDGEQFILYCWQVSQPWT